MEPLLGEIRLFAFERIPKGWHACDGTLLPVREYNALFSLLGDAYGGDGKVTFALPDLRGRVAVAASRRDSLPVGTKGGAEAVQLTMDQIPEHSHEMHATSAAGTLQNIANNYPAVPKPPTGDSERLLYAPHNGPVVSLATASASPDGHSIPHNNMQPFLALQYCIATQGIYPPRP